MRRAHANDVALIARAEREMKETFVVLEREAYKLGLSGNKKESKSLLVTRRVSSVSYTHLDVYKRQVQSRL